LGLSQRSALANDVNTDEEGRLVIAKIATFEGGDAEEMGRRNNEMLVERPTAPRPGSSA
jgi:hypothetical protein